ncbi:SMI1/KNR4 family protein [Micromonospora sp. URMC 106]|uniref:SMI1/KNR4 family protein n=1 Tax=Micromonospora sp. URMC 106 TaxID=3423408 RepID=UPI003F194AF0
MGTDTAVEQAWHRIEDWLSRFAPRFRAELNPPATAAEIDTVATALGVALPADLRIWWGLSNGVRHGLGLPSGTLIPDSSSPYPASMALERWRMHLRVQQEVCPPGMREEMERFVAGQNTQPAGTLLPQLYWLPRWLPIAGDGGGGGLFMDLREGPRHGCLVEFSRHHQGTTPRWESVTQLWVEVAEELEAIDIDLLRADRIGDLEIDGWTPPNS